MIFLTEESDMFSKETKKAIIKKKENRKKTQPPSIKRLEKETLITQTA